MSGFSYPNPILISETYNPAFYLALDPSGFLKYEFAQTLYLSKNDYRLSYITGITPGVATSGIALVPDLSLGLSGLSTVDCTTLVAPTISAGIISASQLNLSGNNGYLSIKDLRTIGRASLTFGNDNRTMEIGLRGSANSAPVNGFYMYSNIGGFRLVIDQNGNMGLGGVLTPAYRLDVVGDINASTGYRLAGAVINLSALTGVVDGTALANKALILDGSTNITNINQITCGAVITAGLTSSSATINGDLNISGGSYKLNGSTLDFSVLSGITPGVAQTSKLLSTDSNNAIQGLSRLQFATSNIDGTHFRTSDVSANGIQVYTLVDSSTAIPAIDFKAGNGGQGSTGTHFMRFGTYEQYNTPETWGRPWGIVGKSSQNGLGGLHITSTGTGGQSVPGGNVHLSCQNGTIPCFTANDKYQSAVILGTGSVNNSDYGSYKCTINAPTQILGNSTVLLLNSTGTTSDRVSMVLSHNIDWELSLGGSAHGIANGLYWYYSGYRMVLMPSGNLGLGGITNPTCTLDVQTSSTLTQTNIATNTYSYNISSGSWTNLGGGPTSFNVCARFRSNVWIQDKLYATSDRRLKRDIKTLDVALDHFKKIRPVSYRFINDEVVKLGVIAQEYITVCGEGVSLAPNESLEADEDSPSGYQFTVDYTSISILNTSAIKKLIALVESQSELITALSNRLDELAYRLRATYGQPST